MLKSIVVLVLIALLCGCTNKRNVIKSSGPPSAVATTRMWTEAATPFAVANITAVGSVFWICGANEMIASSADGGATWEMRYHKDNGAVLLQIGFVDERIGHAVGTDGLLLVTVDGGKHWTEHHVSEDVQAFSFADADNGVAGNRACTISSLIECGPVVVTEQPQAMIWGPGGTQFQMKLPKFRSLPFAEGCVACAVKLIWPDPGLDWHGRVIANFDIRDDGTVENVSTEGSPSNGFVDRQIRDEIANWKFEAPPDSAMRRKNVPIDVNCRDLPQAPAIGGCWLTALKQQSG